MRCGDVQVCDWVGGLHCVPFAHELCIGEWWVDGLRVRGGLHWCRRWALHGMRDRELQGHGGIRDLHGVPFAHELCFGER